jgi:hypothetical protein
MKIVNLIRNLFQQAASSQNAVTQNVSNEPLLPMGFRKLESLSTSFLRLAITLYIIVATLIMASLAFGWLTGHISTDIFIKVLTLLLEALQNLIIV